MGSERSEVLAPHRHPSRPTLPKPKRWKGGDPQKDRRLPNRELTAAVIRANPFNAPETNPVVRADAAHGLSPCFGRPTMRYSRLSPVREIARLAARLNSSQSRTLPGRGFFCLSRLALVARPVPLSHRLTPPVVSGASANRNIVSDGNSDNTGKNLVNPYFL